MTTTDPDPAVMAADEADEDVAVLERLSVLDRFLPLWIGRGRPIEEQPDRGSALVVRHRERLQRTDRLVGAAQRRPRRRQHGQRPGPGHQLTDHLGHRVGHPIAVVEDQQVRLRRQRDPARGEQVRRARSRGRWPGPPS
jgi:hypothetical protein